MLGIFNKMYVRCENYTCKHNLDDHCQKDEIAIKIGYGRIDVFKDGILNVCSNYEDAEKNEEE